MLEVILLKFGHISIPFQRERYAFDLWTVDNEIDGCWLAPG